jgi:hypothetical protein
MAGETKGIFYISALILIITNLIPIFGVLFLGWNQAEVLLMYWSESAVIGFFTVLKMLYSKGAPQNLAINRQPVIVKNKADLSGLKILLIPFFMLHYGMFMLGHFVFLMVFVILGSPFSMSPMLTGDSLSISGVLSLLSTVLIGSFFLFISHGVSFVENYLGKKEYETADPGTLMFAPYSRIILMHFVVIGGAMIGVPLLILIPGKIVIDLWSHLNERKRFSDTIQSSSA